MQGFTENDWKLFRSKIADWQEKYIDSLNKGYIKILTNDDHPSEKFWRLEEQINEDKKKTGVMLEMKRLCLISNIVSLLNDGVIVFDDIEEFSDELKETVHFIIER